MPSESVNASGAAKAIGGVLAIIAVITGVYSMVQPMNQRIENLQSELREVKNTLANIDALNTSVHTQFATELSSIKEKFGQFLAHDSRLKTLEDWRIWWNRDVHPQTACLQARIQLLERFFYNHITTVCNFGNRSKPEGE